MRAALLLAACLLCGAADAPKPDTPQSSPSAWVPCTMADLIILNKVDAKATPITLKVGQQASNVSLSIALRSCVTRPADQLKDSAAYLDIVDSRPGAPVFHGWMLADEPSVSMLQHPVYDVRLVSCHN